MGKVMGYEYEKKNYICFINYIRNRLIARFYASFRSR